MSAIGLSPQVKASIDGRLIGDCQIELRGRLRAAFSLGQLHRQCRFMARLRHADRHDQCPLPVEGRKTSALVEYSAF